MAGAELLAPTVGGQNIVDSVDISSLSDAELLNRMDVLVFRARSSAADVVEHLAEIDRRDICPGREYGSLFDYCVQRLKMSEGSAYRSIRAARAFRVFPPLLNLMRQGRLSLESLALLHPHVEDPDISVLVTKAAGLRTRQLEALLSERRPLDRKREVVRFVGSGPAAGGASPAPVPAPPGESLFSDVGVSALPTTAPEDASRAAASPPRLVRFAFTADEEFYLLLERVRALMRHKYPDGRLEGVLRDALKALLERRDPVIGWGARRTRRRPAAAGSARGSGGAPRPGRGA